ncbi:MAG: hypothetical protein C0404_01955 [Verrucomicrobia bacterium]|nr:hypothetical protein [Verrucomicrobiota bacterium]
MKAVFFAGDGKVRVEEAPKPALEAGTVIVQVKASAICGSELGSFKKTRDPAKKWLNTGHELAGVIAEAPEGSPYRVGMRVGARVVQGCGECHWCRQGYETACAKKKFFAENGHSEYFKLGVNGIQPIPDGVAWPAASILAGDGLGVPARCARLLGDTKGRKIVVVGLGPIGLGCVMVQAFRGARIMGTDISSYRRDLALKLGAEQVVDAGAADVRKAVMDWTDGLGADVVILAVAREDALQTSIELARHHGTLFMVAELGQVMFKLNSALISKELTMTGSWYFTSADWPFMLSLHNAGLKYDRLVTHVYPVDRVQEAFDTFAAGQSGKVILTY